jgi:L-lactate dehydrogenase complex protein LldF
MTAPFNQRIRTSQKDDVLQAALDANAERRVAVRQLAFSTLPGYEAMRQHAHQVRAEVIRNLDYYLERFVERAVENGVIVHRTTTAGEAADAVLEIARQNGVELIAKSKTMVSEEIHLNQKLEQAGLKVVETDLGEYIVQLRGEAPAHIITPAVHLRRQEVGQTFHERLGLPLTDDIPTMTAAARALLRKVFLEAGMGLSGVNFGVVDSGALCIVTNEGNGRMVTTLPPVHVALMGIERLVPTLDDLALMLALLPRSATGQKLTVYTNLIHGPAKPGDPDGARQRHLVLVDNGRRALLDTPLAEMLYCIRCGACLNACPVFREIGGHGYVGAHGQGSAYPGPMGAVLSPALFGASEFGHLARASSLCGACKTACPVDIDLPKLLLRVRAGMVGPVEGQKPAAQPHTPTSEVQKQAAHNAPFYLSLALQVFRRIALRPRLFSLAISAAGAASRLVSPRKAWMRLPAFTGWGFSKDFPRPAVTPFRQRWKQRISQERIREAGEIGGSLSGKHESKIGHAENKELSESRGEGSYPVDSPALMERFSQELQALGGHFTSCDERDLPSLVAGLLKDRGIQDVLAWEQEHLPAGFLQGLGELGVKFTHEPDPTMRAGITGAQGAAAETASLLVASGAGRPLSASLLPEIHIVLLPVRGIDLTLAETMASKASEIRRAASAVWISGPSRTADIEMTLTIGVHGPKEVHVFCWS